LPGGARSLRQGFSGSHTLLTQALRQCHRLGRNTRLAGSKCRLDIRRRCAGWKPSQTALCFWRTTAKAPVEGLGAVHRNWCNATNHATSRAAQGSATGCAGKPLTKPAFAFTKTLQAASGGTRHSTRAGALGNPRTHPSGTGHISRTSSGRSATSGGRCKTSRNSGGNGARYFKSPCANRVLLTVQGKIGALLFEGGFVWRAAKHRTQGSGGFFTATKSKPLQSGSGATRQHRTRRLLAASVLGNQPINKDGYAIAH
jgi:hypothetical protein